jgi:hypothetical protein
VSHGVPSVYRGATRLDGFTNSMLADARSTWHSLSKTQQRALIGARPVQGGRVLCASVPKGTADALVARAIAQPSTIRRHELTGLGAMVREAGMYTKLVAT